MANVSRWSIRNPVATTLCFVMLTLLGLLCFKTLKVRDMPDLNLPMVVLTIPYPGASPAALESEVVNRVEDQLSAIPGLKHSYTTITDSVVTITMEFPLEKNIQEALEDVRSTVAGLRSLLPTDVREPIITRLDITSQVIMAYAVSSSQRSDIELSELVEDVIRPRLSLIPEVNRLGLVGGVSRELRVDLDPVAMSAQGISATQVSRQLKQSYANDVAGQAILGGREQQIRVIAKVRSPEDIGQLEVPLANGRRVRLNDLASVREGVAERTQAALLNGQPIVGFELSQGKGTDQIRFAEQVQASLAAIQADYPDLRFTKTLDFVEIARDEYHGSLQLLLEGAVLTVIIVWLFLKDLRATLISALALPLSIIPTFIGMKYLGFSINIVSLLAISLVIGVLVDDTIVEVENIARHLHKGMTPLQAVMQATDEIGLAVIATTFTLVAVFLPTAFMSGIGGMFFRQFGLTTVVAVLASLLVARMLIPMLTAYLLKPVQREPEEAAWVRHYMVMCRWCLANRKKTLASALLFFVGSLGLAALLPSSFIPADNNTHTQVTLQMPPGARLNEMLSIVRQAETRLLDIRYIEQIYTTVGAGSAGSDPLAGQSAADQATLTLRLAERGQRPDKSQVQALIMARLGGLAGARVSVGLGASNDKYKVYLVGHDKQALKDASNRFEQDLRRIEGLNGVQAQNNLQRAEVSVSVDFQRAADLGVTAADIAQTLRVATVGDYEQNLARYDLPKRQMPVLVKFNDQVRTDLDSLENLLVPGSRGAVRLGEVARLGLDSGPTVISRLDGLYSSGFTLLIGNLNMGEVQQRLQAMPSLQNLPAGVEMRELGDAEANRELVEGFLMSMLAGGLLIYSVLVLLFKDFLQPFTILIALPLAVGGSLVAMLLTGQSFSLSTLIGFIMLMGIVTKNSILLVDYALVAYRQQCVGRTEAVLDACHKRARPIIMTSLAMGFGMLPIALALGHADMTFRSPMAITIIGGLTTSTLLSLLIVPTVFTYVDDFEQWLKKRVNRH